MYAFNLADVLNIWDCGEQAAMSCGQVRASSVVLARTIGGRYQGEEV